METVPDYRRAWRFMRALEREYRESGCADGAATLTYTTLFAVVPTMTVAWALIKAMPSAGGLGERLEALIFNNLVPASGEQVRAYLAGFAEQASNLTGIGVLFLVVTAVMMLLAVERQINAIWRLHRERSLVSSLLVYWALLTLGPVLIGAGLAASSYLLSADLFGETVGNLGLVRVFLEVVPFLVGILFFSLLYIAVPNCSIPVREGVVGGVVAAMLFEGAKAGFTYFVSRFSSYELVYGAFAAVPLFLLWVYISWSITLFGVVLVYMLANWEDDAVARGTPFPALLRVLELFHRRQGGGVAVSEREARHAARSAGIDNWHELREQLLRHRFLERLAGGELVLVRDLHHLRLSELVRLLSWDDLDGAGERGTEGDAFARSMDARLHAALASMNASLDVSVATVLDEHFSSGVPA